MRTHGSLTTRRRAARLAVMLVASVCLAEVDARPAHAALTVDDIKTAYSFAKQAYGYYTDWTKLLTLIDGTQTKGPDLAAELAKVQAAIVAEIQYYVEATLDSQVDAAFTKYREILQNPAQSSSNKNRSAFLACTSSSNDACDIFYELERLITDARSATMAYRLTTDFNTMAVIMGHGIAFKDKYWNETTSWYTWNDRFGNTIRTDYKMVGARWVGCWPGYNPGYRILSASLIDIVTGKPKERTVIGYGGYARDFADTFKRSVLWEKKFANKNIYLGTIESCSPISGCYSVEQYCNPSTHNCAFTGPIVGPPTLLDWRVPSGQTLLQYAEGQVQPAFDADATVAGVRSSMTSIMKMTGGDEDNADPGDPNIGEFVNPWVDEGNVCGPNGPWAYPTTP